MYFNWVLYLKEPYETGSHQLRDYSFRDEKKMWLSTLTCEGQNLFNDCKAS